MNDSNKSAHKENKKEKLLIKKNATETEATPDDLTIVNVMKYGNLSRSINVPKSNVVKRVSKEQSITWKGSSGNDSLSSDNDNKNFKDTQKLDYVTSSIGPSDMIPLIPEYQVNFSDRISYRNYNEFIQKHLINLCNNYF